MSVEECLKKLPKKIKIGAYDWKLILVDEEFDPPLCGQTMFEVQEIRLWPKNLTSAGHAVGIMLHEIWHIWWDNANLDRPKRAELEEMSAVCHEVSTISLWRDNPRFRRWMMRWHNK